MRFLITRASGKHIGDEYSLLEKAEHERYRSEHGIIEIKSLDELPKEEFVLTWGVTNSGEEALETMGFSESYVEGTITLYDDYIE
jgi:hypothetical protein